MTAMRRFLSFRDFDWALLGMVLALCTISVFEIYSATLRTRFSGFHTRQIFFIVAGLVVMFVLAKIDYHRLIDWSPWAYGHGRSPRSSLRRWRCLARCSAR